MALLTVSKPKPECSRSNSTKSQPADFKIWPMPGVANSMMKCPSFAARVPAIAFSSWSIAVLPGPLRSARRPLVNEVAADHRLLGHQRPGFALEAYEVRRAAVRVERRLVVVDLVEQHPVGLAP